LREDCDRDLTFPRHDLSELCLFATLKKRMGPACPTRHSRDAAVTSVTLTQRRPRHAASASMENDMKKILTLALLQILVFGLLGASIWTGAGLTLFAFGFWHSDLTLDTLGEMAGLFTTVLPYAMVYACTIALFDLVLSSLKMPYRTLASALAGACSMAWMFAGLADPAKLVSVGVLGALPAALRSWLCKEIADRKLAGDGPSPPQASAASPG
jgi:hypothetical protein